MARNRWSVVFGVALAVMVWSPGALAVGSDPSPAEIITGWASLSGGLYGKVVYWEANTIRVMDLIDGSVTDVLSVPDEFGEQSMAPYPVWSPDGTKICYYRTSPNRSFWVVNEDSSNPEAVIQWVDYDYGCNSWWSLPTDAGDWIVAQKNTEIVRVKVNADNTPGSTVVVLADPGGGVDWLGLSGYYVGYTLWSGHPLAPPSGGNACIVVNWQTLAQHDTAPLDVGACSMNIKQDGSGTSICAYGGHSVGRVTAFSGTVLDNWSRLTGERIEMMRWSHHPDFVCQNANRMTTPRADQRAWIRKLSNDVYTVGDYLFLGYGMWGPDVWVGGPVVVDTITVTSPNGGGTWTEGDSEPVTWTSEGSVTNVKIELSTNGGASWTTLDASTPNDISEPVTVPRVESTQCRIRVSDTDGSPSDMSDGNFTILYLDTDSDGLPDWWEEEHFSDPMAADPGVDEEPDGLDNLEEYLAGTDPNNDDTDGDGIKDGVDNDPLNPPSPLTGGCSPGGGAAAAAFVLLFAVAAVRRRWAR